MNFFNDRLILGSASPRRQSLLKEAGFEFEILVKETPEDFPPELKGEKVALYVAEKKAAAYDNEVKEGKTIITADTIVCVDNVILGKPESVSQAIEMLMMLSGRDHQVITAVCIRNYQTTQSFAVTTTVTFRKLEADEILWYIENYKPFDKAGAYGIQEWIGLVAITGIDGSYNNVVGLPVAEVYDCLMKLKR